jgi:hypothetical protein
MAKKVIGADCLCHINDLPLCVRSQVRLFADDCLLQGTCSHVYRSVKTQQDQQQFQTDLHLLERWATKWRMRFNATKYYIMSIHRSRNPLTTVHTTFSTIIFWNMCRKIRT